MSDFMPASAWWNTDTTSAHIMSLHEAATSASASVSLSSSPQSSPHTSHSHLSHTSSTTTSSHPGYIHSHTPMQNNNNPPPPSSDTCTPMPLGAQFSASPSDPVSQSMLYSLLHDLQTITQHHAQHHPTSSSTRTSIHHTYPHINERTSIHNSYHHPTNGPPDGSHLYHHPLPTLAISQPHFAERSHHHHHQQQQQPQHTEYLSPTNSTSSDGSHHHHHKHPDDEPRVKPETMSPLRSSITRKRKTSLPSSPPHSTPTPTTTIASRARNNKNRPSTLPLADGGEIHLGARRSRYARQLEQIYAALQHTKKQYQTEKRQREMLEHQLRQVASSYEARTRSGHSLIHPQETAVVSEFGETLTSHTIYESMFVKAPMSICYMTPDLRVLDCNMAFLEFNGWDHSDVVNKFFPEGPSPNPTVNDIIKAQRQGNVMKIKCLPAGMSDMDMIAMPGTVESFFKIFSGQVPSITVHTRNINNKGQLVEHTVIFYTVFSSDPPSSRTLDHQDRPTIRTKHEEDEDVTRATIEEDPDSPMTAASSPAKPESRDISVNNSGTVSMSTSRSQSRSPSPSPTHSPLASSFLGPPDLSHHVTSDATPIDNSQRRPAYFVGISVTSEAKVVRGAPPAGSESDEESEEAALEQLLTRARVHGQALIHQAHHHTQQQQHHHTNSHTQTPHGHGHSHSQTRNRHHTSD